jgi:DNA-binding transcriptional MerR regulator
MSSRDINIPNKTDQLTEKLFTTQEFADRLGISVRTLYNHRMLGLLNFSQSCNKAPVLFSLQDEIDYRNAIKRFSQHK